VCFTERVLHDIADVDFRAGFDEGLRHHPADAARPGRDQHSLSFHFQFHRSSKEKVTTTALACETRDPSAEAPPALDAKRGRDPAPRLGPPATARCPDDAR